MKVYPISRDDSSIIKGLAIVSIILHNFFHKLEPAPGENEFYFSPETVRLFFQQLGDFPFDAISILFSFLGHYGVQLFIFMSGFGLALSYAKDPVGWGRFVAKRLQKLYPLLLTGMAVFLLVYCVEYKSYPPAMVLKELLQRLLFVHTIIPNEGCALVGPWWFFSLIFQLYLLFPFLYRAIQRYQTKALVALCVVSYGWILGAQYFVTHSTNLSLMQNAPGHVMEFAFGIWFACNRGRNLHWLWCLGAALFFCLGNWFLPFWPGTFLCVTLIFLFAFPKIKTVIAKIPGGTPLLSYLGSISMLLFATHALFREPFLAIAESRQIAPWILLTDGVFLAVSVVIAVASERLYAALCGLFGKISVPERLQKPLEVFCKAGFLLLAVYVVGFYAISSAKPFGKKDFAATLTRQEATIGKGDMFTDMVVLTFPESANAISVSVAFDSDKEDAPSLISSISQETFWEELKFHRTKTEDGFHYATHCSFYSSCFQTLKGKDLGLYFWNTDGAECEIKNFSYEISTR